MRKLRYLAPNGVTLTSLALALVSIVLSQRGDFESASWLILYSVLLDKVDGWLARRLDAQSRMGVELDSFADFVAFGVAPGFLLVGLIASTMPDQALHPVQAAALVFVFGCVLRLARFNVADASEHPDLFHGVPSTLAGGLAAATVLVALRHEADRQLLIPAFAVLLVVLGIGMVAPVYIPKVGTARSRAGRTLTLVNGVVTYALVLLRWLPEVLLAFGLAYLAGGIIVGRQRIRERRAAAGR